MSRGISGWFLGGGRFDKASQNSCDTSCDVSAELPGLILFTNLRFSPSQETRTMPTPDYATRQLNQNFKKTNREMKVKFLIPTLRMFD